MGWAGEKFVNLRTSKVETPSNILLAASRTFGGADSVARRLRTMLFGIESRGGAR